MDLYCLRVFILWHAYWILILTLFALFKVGSGVRRGESSLSPYLFSLFFINKVIMDLKMLDLCCYVNKNCIGCVLYVYDIILLSLYCLQTVLIRVCSTVCEPNLSINCSESTCVSFGPNYRWIYHTCNSEVNNLCGQKVLIFYQVLVLYVMLITLLVNFNVIVTVYMLTPAACPKYCSYILS